jgi:hypothetical protein
VLTFDGLWLVGDGRTARVVHTQGNQDPPFPPAWAGLKAARVALLQPTALARTATGDWLIATRDAVALLTAPGTVPHRLAVALHTETRATLRRRQVRVAATRAATVTVRIRGRTVARGAVSAGVSTLRLSSRLPAGTLDLRLRAVGEDGAVASHRLNVISGRDLPLATARRAAFDAASNFGGDIQPYVERCRRLRPRAVLCSVSGVGEDRLRGRIELRADGWLWISWGERFYRADIR